MAKRSIGYILLVTGSMFLLALLLAGQTMSFIDYDLTVSLGLQESEELVGELGVAVNKGFGVADSIIYIPVLIIGIVGLWKRKKWGVFSMTAALGITAYWPLVCLFIVIFGRDVPGFSFPDFVSYILILSAISVYGLWGLWYLYKNQELLINSAN